MHLIIKPLSTKFQIVITLNRFTYLRWCHLRTILEQVLVLRGRARLSFVTLQLNVLNVLAEQLIPQQTVVGRALPRRVAILPRLLLCALPGLGQIGDCRKAGHPVVVCPARYKPIVRGGRLTGPVRVCLEQVADDCWFNCRLQWASVFKRHDRFGGRF